MALRVYSGQPLVLMETKMKKIILITATAAFLTACTTTGNVERNAALGAAGGALAGAIIGNNTGSGDARTGAIIGGTVGAAGGAYSGVQEDRAMGQRTQLRRNAQGQELTYDSFAGRYYFTDRTTGNTYWQNGSLRTTRGY